MLANPAFTEKDFTSLVNSYTSGKTLLFISFGEKGKLPYGKDSVLKALLNDSLLTKDSLSTMAGLVNNLDADFAFESLRMLLSSPLADDSLLARVALALTIDTGSPFQRLNSNFVPEFLSFQEGNPFARMCLALSSSAQGSSCYPSAEELTSLTTDGLSKFLHCLPVALESFASDWYQSVEEFMSMFFIMFTLFVMFHTGSMNSAVLSIF